MKPPILKTNNNTMEKREQELKKIRQEFDCLVYGKNKPSNTDIFNFFLKHIKNQDNTAILFGQWINKNATQEKGICTDNWMTIDNRNLSTEDLYKIFYPEFESAQSEADREIERLKERLKNLEDYTFQLTEDRDLKAREQDRYTKLYVETLQKYDALKEKADKMHDALCDSSRYINNKPWSKDIQNMVCNKVDKAINDYMELTGKEAKDGE